MNSARIRVRTGTDPRPTRDPSLPTRDLSWPACDPLLLVGPVPVGRLGRGRRNEEGAWGKGQGELAKGLGLLKQGELVRGWGAWAPSRNAISPLQAWEGKKGKNQKLKRTKIQHPQRLLFHFILI